MSSGVDTWHITLLVSPVPGGGPALWTLQGPSNPFHLLPSLYSSSLGPQSPPRDAMVGPTGHRAPGKWGGGHPSCTPLLRQPWENIDCSAG